MPSFPPAASCHATEVVEVSIWAEPTDVTLLWNWQMPGTVTDQVFTLRAMTVMKLRELLVS